MTRVFGLVLAATLTFLGPSTFGAKLGPPLVVEDFDGGRAQGWQLKGGQWAIQNGVLFQQDERRNVIGSCSYPQPMEHARVEVRMRFAKEGLRGTATVNMRMSDGNLYEAALDPKTGKVRLSKRVKDRWCELAAQDVNLGAERWYNFAAEALGPRLRVFLDGRLVLDAFDAVLSSGLFGIGTYDGMVAFDDLKIWKLSAPTEESGLVSTEPGLRVLAFEGLYFWVYGCGPEELRSLGASEVTDSYLVRENQKNSLEKAPRAADALPRHNVVLVADVDASAFLKAGFNVEMLRPFVQQGGGLVILGGQFSFGANYEATALEDLCPVEPSKSFNLVKAEPPLPLKPAGEHSIIKGLDFGEHPVVVWYHRVRPRPDAQVILRAGDEPLLVVREVGKGRVVVFLGSVLGEPANPLVPFWKSKLWSELLRRTLNWAGGQKEK